MKSLKKLFSATLAAVALLVLAGTVSASPQDDTTYDDPWGAVITKHLELPAGTTPPATTFAFAFEAVSHNDSTAAAAVDAMPAIPNATAAFTANSTVVNQGPARPGVDRATLTTDNVLETLSSADWGRTGVFVYRVTELNTTFTNTATEMMFFDSAVFYLTVNIVQDDQGRFFPHSAFAERSEWIDGSWVTGPKGPVWQEDPAWSYNNRPNESHINFINNFVRLTPGGDDHDPEIDGLITTKTLAGPFADTQDIFDFTGTITSSDVILGLLALEGDDALTAAQIAALTNFRAYVYHTPIGGGALVRGRSTAAQPATPLPAFYDFVAGTEFNFVLRGNERLVITNVPVGNEFVITELAHPDYAPALDLTVDGSAFAQVSRERNTALSTVDVLPAGVRRVGEALTRAAFTNTHADAPETGLITGNLPVILVGLASLGLVALVVVSKKRRAYE